jgi:hypothetical protein
LRAQLALKRAPVSKLVGPFASLSAT